ncbi:hypothetical protein EDC94DRAFT_689831 [Helicostylum pulchrum]|nr:hypothetical protein EDC94DRAFT_689831 [Helicostylum pulchrum]
MRKTLILCFISSLVTSIVSYEVPPRNAAYCAYLAKKIYCYGGSSFNENYSNNMYQLDIHNQPTDSINGMINKWIENRVDSLSETATEYRYDSGFIALPNGVEMLFQGGTNDKNYAMIDKTVAYNAETDSWGTLPSYDDTKNGGVRQISAQSSVYIPTMDSIGFYGGKEFHARLNTSYITASGQTLPANLVYSYPSKRNPGYRQVESYVGFYYLTLFNLKTHAWTVATADPPKLNGLLYMVSFQTATFHPRSGKIYYIGGLYKTSEPGGSLSVPFSFANTYDTVDAIWGNQTLNASPNNNIPIARHLHTATMASTNEDIIVYGGTNLPEDEKPNALMDYVYTLNLETHTWISHDITAPVGSPGPRYYHSAVLVDDTSLFILFGMTKDKTATNTMLVLDLRNISSLSFSETYPLSNLSVASSDNSSSVASPDNSSSGISSGISSGAIAGIAVGAVVLILIIAAIIVFCIRKKKRASSEEKMEEMPVDWDHIEGIYKEDPPGSSVNFRDSRSPTGTMLSSRQVPFSSVDHHVTRTSTQSPVVVPDVYTAKPDAVEKNLR